MSCVRSWSDSSRKSPRRLSSRSSWLFACKSLILGSTCFSGRSYADRSNRHASPITRRSLPSSVTAATIGTSRAKTMSRTIMVQWFSALQVPVFAQNRVGQFVKVRSLLRRQQVDPGVKSAQFLLELLGGHGLLRQHFLLLVFPGYGLREARKKARPRLPPSRCKRRFRLCLQLAGPRSCPLRRPAAFPRLRSSWTLRPESLCRENVACISAAAGKIAASFPPLVFFVKYFEHVTHCLARYYARCRVQKNRIFPSSTNFELVLLNRILNDVGSLKVGFAAEFAAGRLRRQDFGLLLEGTVERFCPGAFCPPGDFHCAFCVFLT